MGSQDATDPAQDEALGLDHRPRAQPLEGGGRRRDDLLRPEGGHEGLGEIRAARRGQRRLLQPAQHGGASGAEEGTVAEFALQSRGVFVPRVLPESIAFDVAPIRVHLISDHPQHRLGDDLAGPQQPTREPQRADLQGEAEPVLGFTTSADAEQVVLSECVPAQAGVVVGWKTKQGPALAGGEDAPVRHDLRSVRFVEL